MEQCVLGSLNFINPKLIFGWLKKINQEDSSNFWQPNIRLVWNKNWFENNYWKWHTTNNLKMNPEKKLVRKITTFSGFLKLPRGGGPRSWTNEGKKNPSLRDFRSNFWLSKRSASKINCHWTFLRIEMQTRFLVFWNMPEALKRLKIESKAIPERSLKCIIA